jgi:hypothetical protein
MIFYGLSLAPYYFRSFGFYPLKNTRNSNPSIS